MVFLVCTNLVKTLTWLFECLIQNARRINLCIKFIILTGYAEFEYAKEAVKLGVSKYLLKPLNDDELFDTLDGILMEIKERAKLESLVESSCSNILDLFYNII